MKNYNTGLNYATQKIFNLKGEAPDDIMAVKEITQYSEVIVGNTTFTKRFRLTGLYMWGRNIVTSTSAKAVTRITQKGKISLYPIPISPLTVNGTALMLTFPTPLEMEIGDTVDDATPGSAEETGFNIFGYYIE